MSVGGTTVEVIGADTLASTMTRAAAQLDDLHGAAQQSGQLLVSRGRANAPKRTGRLAGSVRASETRGGNVEVGSTLIYAPVIHNGWPAHNIRANPFLNRAAQESTDQVGAIYTRDVEHVLAGVKGA